MRPARQTQPVTGISARQHQRHACSGLQSIPCSAAAEQDAAEQVAAEQPTASRGGGAPLARPPQQLGLPLRMGITAPAPTRVRSFVRFVRRCPVTKLVIRVSSMDLGAPATRGQRPPSDARLPHSHRRDGAERLRVVGRGSMQDQANEPWLVRVMRREIDPTRTIPQPRAQRVHAFSGWWRGTAVTPQGAGCPRVLSPR